MVAFDPYCQVVILLQALTLRLPTKGRLQETLRVRWTLRVKRTPRGGLLELLGPSQGWAQRERRPPRERLQELSRPSQVSMLLLDFDLATTCIYYMYMYMCMYIFVCTYSSSCVSMK